MAYIYNQCIFSGRVAKELLYSKQSEGRSRLQLLLAVQRPMKKDSVIKDVDFIPIVLFGPRADWGYKLIYKGCPLLVWGRLQIRSYESKEGEKKWSSEIKAENFQILSYKKEDEGQSKKALISAGG